MHVDGIYRGSDLGHFNMHRKTEGEERVKKGTPVWTGVASCRPRAPRVQNTGTMAGQGRSRLVVPENL